LKNPQNRSSEAEESPHESVYLSGEEQHHQQESCIAQVFHELEQTALSVESEQSEDIIISPALADNASSSRSNSSGDPSQPVSPEPIVSPNPSSPVNASVALAVTSNQAAVDTNYWGRVAGFTTPSVTSLPTSPRGYQSVYETPLSLPPLPESQVVSPAVDLRRHLNNSTLSVRKSRIAEVSDLRNDKLCLQVFGFWKSQVLLNRIDSLVDRLESTRKASETVLNDNNQLRARLVELENAIKVVHSIPRKDASTSTEDDMLVAPTKPAISVPIPKASSNSPTIAYSTPLSQPSLASGFLTPVSSSGTPVLKPSIVPISIATPLPPSAEARRSWEDYLRPSSDLVVSNENKPDVSPTFSPNMGVPKPAMTRDKLRSISDDLQKLSESLALAERRRRDNLS
jgi:hypothetical protein